jgi:TonB family protein
MTNGNDHNPPRQPSATGIFRMDHEAHTGQHRQHPVPGATGGQAGPGSQAQAPLHGASARNTSPEVPADKRMKLVGISRAVAGKQWLLDRSNLHLGRSEDNDVVVEHPSVADTHARLTFEDGRYVLSDLGSESGIRVNLEQYRRFVLDYNDLVMIGDVRFRFLRPHEVVSTEGGSVSIYVTRPDAARTARRARLYIVGGVLLVVGLLALAVKVYWGGPDAIERFHRTDTTLSDEQLAQRLERGRALFKDEKWPEARMLFEEIRGATRDRPGPIATQAINYLDLISRESEAKEQAERIKVLREEGKPDEALAALGEVLPRVKGTRYEDRLTALEPELKKVAVEMLLGKARAAVREHRLVEAQQLADRAVSLDPASKEAKGFKAGLVRLVARKSGGGSPSDEGEVEIVYQQAAKDLEAEFDMGNTAPLLATNTGRAPASTGKLPQEAVESTVAAHRAEIRWCYQQGLQANPDLRGKVVVEFTVSEAGDVSAARVKESTVGIAEVEQCLVSKLRRWHFPAPSGGSVTVFYPFAFSAMP